MKEQEILSKIPMSKGRQALKSKHMHIYTCIKDQEQLPLLLYIYIFFFLMTKLHVSQDASFLLAIKLEECLGVFCEE